MNCNISNYNEYICIYICPFIIIYLPAAEVECFKTKEYS